MLLVFSSTWDVGGKWRSRPIGQNFQENVGPRSTTGTPPIQRKSNCGWTTLRDCTICNIFTSS